MRIWSDNLQLPYKFDSHQFIMVEMVIIFKMVRMVTCVGQLLQFLRCLFQRLDPLTQVLLSTYLPSLCILVLAQVSFLKISRQIETDLL